MAEELPKCFDPYLRYAIESKFKNFEFFDPRESKLFLFVELKTAERAEDFKRAMSPSGFGAEFGLTSPNSRYLTMRAFKRAIEPESFRVWNDNVSRVELSLPLKPTGIEKGAQRNRSASDAAPTSLLIGVIDDGCPFAASQFVKWTAGVATGTRVRGIWDQTEHPGRAPIPVGADVFGEKPFDFNYGLEFLRDSVSGVLGLNDWIQLHKRASTVDEHGCYADGGFKTLKHQGSHGAHVMDVLAGRIPLSARIARGEPPNWQPGDPLSDPACEADIVFVQFPESCLRDATGIWLKGYVADAIDYIMSFVDSGTTNVVINVSYGPTTGPHNGTAELEGKLRELVTYYDGTSGNPKLDVFLPAGNNYLSDGHVRFVRQTTADPDYVEWTWRLPPDNTVLCFTEVWMKKHHTGGVVVTLTSPGGHSSSSTAGPPPPPPPPPPPGVPALPPYTGAYAPVVWGDDRVWLMAVEPTVARTGAVPEHGNWKIKVEGIGVGHEVHAYVARTDPNMNMSTGAKRSYFVDAGWEAGGAAGAGCTYAGGEFDRSGSLVSRLGTLNGIGTDSVAGVHVPGGYILSAPKRKSPYSSAGRARTGPYAQRIGPDYALFCDESDALQGVRAGGNRSGVVFRLIGTSAAAPQLARLVADGKPLTVHDAPASPPDEKRGWGDLDPP
ncbi:hypothetical protein JQ581_20735 [Bradyrhizobium liaoningense]|uniref:hypothetical protein n=1 Tax=Bradyrhizobium liaoningense TaxID=43992 RepID=UPI001BAA87C6|nr:hypothetical protein [Bradyrhizobium liaoningense]MBR0739363.1 hypothetical protein [Bradyrhizobium liaoningense]